MRAEPGRSNVSYLLAQLGGKWHVADEPDIDELLDTRHANASAPSLCKGSPTRGRQAVIIAALP